jgi:hypothetical protein
MTEGWINNRYFVLFDEHEVEEATRAYLGGGELPGYTVVGLESWDDLIVRDAGGSTFTLPSVPLEPTHLSSASMPADAPLSPDSRFTGKIKWYIKPLVFGGDPRDNSNIAWISHDQHREAVAWWNQKYREIKHSGMSDRADR